MRSQPSNLADNSVELEKSNKGALQLDSSSETVGGLKLNANLADIKVIRRNGSVVTFEDSKIAVAMTKAFLAVNGGHGAASARVREQTELFTSQIVDTFLRRLPAGGAVHIEEIQDQVELSLMRAGEHEVARAYVLYREKRSKERQQKDLDNNVLVSNQLTITVDGKLQNFDKELFIQIVDSACTGYEEFVNSKDILDEAFKNIYDGIPFEEVFKSIILSARTLIEKDPAYAKVSAQLLLYSIRKEVLGFDVEPSQMQKVQEEYFSRFIKKGSNTKDISLYIAYVGLGTAIILSKIT
jgi:ribonucleoside-diphosphate reductase alpha chain